MKFIPFTEVDIGCLIKIGEYPCKVKSITMISGIIYRIRGMNIFTKVTHSDVFNERDFIEVPVIIQKRWRVLNSDSDYLYLIDQHDRRKRVNHPGRNLQNRTILCVITMEYGNRCKVITYET